MRILVDQRMASRGLVFLSFLLCWCHSLKPAIRKPSPHSLRPLETDSLPCPFQSTPRWIHRCKDFVVVDKPSGWATASMGNTAQMSSPRPSAAAWVAAETGLPLETVAALHILDVDCSGVLCFTISEAGNALLKDGKLVLEEEFVVATETLGSLLLQSRNKLATKEALESKSPTPQLSYQVETEHPRFGTVVRCWARQGAKSSRLHQQGQRHLRTQLALAGAPVRGDIDGSLAAMALAEKRGASSGEKQFVRGGGRGRGQGSAASARGGRSQNRGGGSGGGGGAGGASGGCGSSGDGGGVDVSASRALFHCAKVTLHYSDPTLSFSPPSTTSATANKKNKNQKPVKDGGRLQSSWCAPSLPSDMAWAVVKAHANKPNKEEKKEQKSDNLRWELHLSHAQFSPSPSPSSPPKPIETKATATTSMGGPSATPPPPTPTTTITAAAAAETAAAAATATATTCFREVHGEADGAPKNFYIDRYGPHLLVQRPESVPEGVRDEYLRALAASPASSSIRGDDGAAATTKTASTRRDSSSSSSSGGGGGRMSPLEQGGRVYEIVTEVDRSKGAQKPPSLLEFGSASSASPASSASGEGDEGDEDGVKDGGSSDGAVAFPVFEFGVAYHVEIGKRLSTGLFLDQRPQRHWLSQPKNVKGLSVLNLFAHAGGYSVAAAVGGAKRTVSVDVSASWLAYLDKSLAYNGVPNPLLTADGDDEGGDEGDDDDAVKVNGGEVAIREVGESGGGGKKKKNGVAMEKKEGGGGERNKGVRRHQVICGDALSLLERLGRKAQTAKADKQSRSGASPSSSSDWKGSEDGLFDLVILDPPSTFTKSKKKRWSANSKDYTDLVASAAKCVAPRGALWTTTNCRKLLPRSFARLVLDGLPAGVVLERVAGPAVDHPVIAGKSPEVKNFVWRFP